MKKIVSAVILSLLALLAGCNATLYTKYAVEKPSLGMDEQMLLAQLGPPRHVIESTLLGGPQTYSYVYQTEEGCAATYTVEAATKQVLGYRCFM